MVLGVKLKNKQQQRNKEATNRRFRLERFSIECSRSKLKTKVIGNFHDSVILTQLRTRIQLAHRPITTFRQPLTNVKDKDDPKDRQGAVDKINAATCQATYIGETGRNLNVRLTEHKRATRNGDINNQHMLSTIDKQTTHSTGTLLNASLTVLTTANYHQRIALESWFTNLEQTRLNCCHNFPRLTNDLLMISTTIDKPTNFTNNSPNY